VETLLWSIPYIVMEVDCKSNYVYLVPFKLTTIWFPHAVQVGVRVEIVSVNQLATAGAERS